MRWQKAAIILAALALVYVVAERGRQARRPQPGDTVSPHFDYPPQWAAGKPGSLAVRLTARGPGDRSPRRLDFDGFPESVNPVAHVTFFAGEESVSTLELRLSHRC